MTHTEREQLNHRIAEMMSKLTEEQYIDFLFALQDIRCPAKKDKNSVLSTTD